MAHYHGTVGTYIRLRELQSLLHCYHKLVQGEHSLVLTSLPSILEVDHQGLYLQRAYTIISLKRKLGKELLVTSDPSLTKSGVYWSRNKNLASKAEKAAKSAGIFKANYMVMHLDLASLDSVCQFMDSYK
ncbi:hypothetical protein PTKIN_Ptkin14bG0109600 [Pterospermum kingtungense]